MYRYGLAAEAGVSEATEALGCVSVSFRSLKGQEAQLSPRDRAMHHVS